MFWWTMTMGVASGRARDTFLWLCFLFVCLFFVFFFFVFCLFLSFVFFYKGETVQSARQRGEQSADTNIVWLNIKKLIEFAGITILQKKKKKKKKNRKFSRITLLLLFS